MAIAWGGMGYEAARLRVQGVPGANQDVLEQPIQK
jgi:hypothetical protein